MAPFSKEDKMLIKSLYECKGYIHNRVLDEQQHQLAAGEVERIRNSATRNFHHFRRCNLGRILNTQNRMSSNFLTSVLCMFKCLQIMCAKYYELRYMFYKKNCTSSKLARLPDTASISVSGLKDEKFTEKANLHKN